MRRKLDQDVVPTLESSEILSRREEAIVPKRTWQFAVDVDNTLRIPDFQGARSGSDRTTSAAPRDDTYEMRFTADLSRGRFALTTLGLTETLPYRRLDEIERA